MNTADLKLQALARELIDYVEELCGAKMSSVQYDDAVRFTLAAFSHAEKINLRAEFDNLVAGWGHNPPGRWCSKCEARYAPGTPCPHFVPHPQQT